MTWRDAGHETPSAHNGQSGCDRDGSTCGRSDGVILYCSFEELAAATAGGNRLLSAATATDQPVIAPPEAHADLEFMLPQLTGDIEIATLHEQRRLRRALAYLNADLAARMDHLIISQHPAAEDTVLAYFDYAHVRGLLDRVDAIGTEMEAIIELATGAAPDDNAARTFTFLE